MVAYKRFEFDNFVVDDEEDNVITTIESEPALSVSEDIIEPVVEEETIALLEPEPEHEIEVITFSEEELSAAKIQAEQEGYNKGYQAKSEELENTVNELLSDINNKLSAMFSAQDKFQEKIEQDFIKFNRTILQKLLPELSDEYAVDILNRFLANNFSNFRAEPKLSFFFSPQIASSMQEQVAKLAHIHDFEGKISLHKDNTLSLSACRIEWENGGVSYSPDNLLEKVNNLLEENTSKN